LIKFLFDLECVYGFDTLSEETWLDGVMTLPGHPCVLL